MSLHVSPYPFAMIVALAASTAFMTPVSSPVNTLVVTPGNYTFGDFVRSRRAVLHHRPDRVRDPGALAAAAVMRADCCRERFARNCHMSHSSEAAKSGTSKIAMQKILDVVERVGNSVPHPVVIFLILIAVVMVLSHILYLLGASVSYQVINPDTHEVEIGNDRRQQPADSRGIRHMYTGWCRTSWASRRSVC